MTIEEKVSTGPSFSHWLEPSFPLNFLYDLSNYFFLTLILFFFLKYKFKFDHKQICLFVVLMASPFFFNGLLIDWQMFPDQSKYISGSRIFRKVMYDPQNLIQFLEDKVSRKVNISSIFYGLFPFVNFETYKSIGFINRFLYLFIIIFLSFKKNIPLNLKLFLIFSPSLTMYSSISLREILILFVMVFLTYFLLYKKYFKVFLLTLFLSLIKIQNLVLVYTPYLLSISINRVKNVITFYLITFIFILLFYFNLDYIFFKINKVSFGFFSETYGAYKSVFSNEHFVQMNLNNFIPILFNNIKNFILSPYPNISSIPEAVIFFENIVIYLLFYKQFFYKFFKKSRAKKMLKFYWIITLFLAVAMYSIVSFNDGTIHRYKIIILTYILIAYNLHLYKKKKI